MHLLQVVLKKIFLIINHNSSAGIAPLLVLVGIAVVAIALPTTVILVQQEQDNRQLAAGPTGKSCNLDYGEHKYIGSANPCDQEAPFCIEGTCHANQNPEGGICGERNDCESGLFCVGGTCSTTQSTCRVYDGDPAKCRATVGCTYNSNARASTGTCTGTQRPTPTFTPTPMQTQRPTPTTDPDRDIISKPSPNVSPRVLNCADLDALPDYEARCVSSCPYKLDAFGIDLRAEAPAYSCSAANTVCCIRNVSSDEQSTPTPPTSTPRLGGQQPQLPPPTRLSAPGIGWCANYARENAQNIDGATCDVKNVAQWDGKSPNPYCEQEFGGSAKYFFACNVSSGETSPLPPSSGDSSCTGPASGPCNGCRNGVAKYLQPRCGTGTNGNFESSRQGTYCGQPYFDVYECKDGSYHEIPNPSHNNTCNNIPWCINQGTPVPTVGANTPTPTLYYTLECPSDGNHICAASATCDGQAGYSPKAAGHQACSEHTGNSRPFCCMKANL